MNLKEKKEKLIYLLELIEKGRCTSLSEMAKRFDCSKRTIKRMVAILREEGNNIRYCQKNRKFIKSI